MKDSPIVLLLLFEALNTPTNKLYNTSMRDATQWVNLQHFVQKRVVKITLWISNYLILFTVPIDRILIAALLAALQTLEVLLDGANMADS